jgi:hypothetical protein
LASSTRDNTRAPHRKKNNKSNKSKPLPTRRSTRHAGSAIELSGSSDSDSD